MRHASGKGRVVGTGVGGGETVGGPVVVGLVVVKGNVVTGVHTLGIQRTSELGSPGKDPQTPSVPRRGEVNCERPKTSNTTGSL